MNGTMRMIAGDSTRIVEIVPGNAVLRPIFPDATCGTNVLQLLQNGRATLGHISESIALTAPHIESLKRALAYQPEQLAFFYCWLHNPVQAMDEFHGEQASGVAPRDADSLPESKPSYRRS